MLTQRAVSDSSPLLTPLTLVQFPRKTALFVESTLQGLSLEDYTLEDMPQGCFSQIRGFSLGNLRGVIKTSCSEEEMIRRDELYFLEREACVYMAFTEEPHLISLEACSNNTLYLEHGGTDFFNFMDLETFNPTYQELLTYFYQITEGLIAMHQKHLSQEDLKSENILIDNTDPTYPKLKLCDFGLVGQTGSFQPVFNGSIEYEVPSRVLLFESQDSGKLYPVLPNKVVWSLGILLYECISGGKLPYGNSIGLIERSINKALRNRGSFPIPSQYVNFSDFINKELGKLEAQWDANPNVFPSQSVKKLATTISALYWLHDSYNKKQDAFKLFSGVSPVLLYQRDPEGVFRSLILDCLDGDDTRRPSIEAVFKRLEAAFEFYR
jgi:serine/threonine protein kinase